MGARIHVELLLSRQVLDVEGKPAGRIEEIVARRQDEEWLIESYLLGRKGLIERLSIPEFVRAFVHLLGGRKRVPTHQVPWKQMDLSEAQRPRLRCRAEDVERWEAE